MLIGVLKSCSTYGMLLIYVALKKERALGFVKDETLDAYGM